MRKGPIIALVGLFFIILSFVMYSGYCFVLIGPPDKTQQALCGSSVLFFSLGIILLIGGLLLHLRGRK